MALNEVDLLSDEMTDFLAEKAPGTPDGQCARCPLSKTKHCENYPQLSCQGIWQRYIKEEAGKLRAEFLQLQETNALYSDTIEAMGRLIAEQKNALSKYRYGAPGGTHA